MCLADHVLVTNFKYQMTLLVTRCFPWALKTASLIQYDNIGNICSVIYPVVDVFREKTKNNLYECHFLEFHLNGL